MFGITHKRGIMKSGKTKKLDEMTSKELCLNWQKRIEKHLLGKSIVKVE